AGERAAKRPAELVGSRDDVAIAAITVAEMLLVVELAEGRHRRARQTWVEAVLSTFYVEDYGVDVARVHATLLGHVRRSGRPRGAHDLIVAATSIATDRMVVTLDRADFTDLPGVNVLS
ncbi:MAG: PIN domain-containing protein, partial [Actinomycetota bacterium]